MIISRIKIKNFRSIQDQEIFVGDHNVFVGENNSGKSNLIDAIRFFYDELKISESDFFDHIEDEMFVEIEFKLTEASKMFFEKEGSKYILDGNKIIVRKKNVYSGGSIKDDGRRGVLKETDNFDEDNKFFGFSGVSKAMLADIIYIPPIKHVNDELKTTNQSTIMMKIIKKVVGDKIEHDPEFEIINSTLTSINNKNFFNEIERDLSIMMSSYDCDVKFSFDKISSKDVVSKTQLKLQEKDGTLPMDVSNKGLGTQRALLIHLLRYWARKEIEEKSKGKDSIAPTIILIEEPEVFQHPQKQKMFFYEIKALSNEISTQVFVNTHSSHFKVEKDDDLMTIFRTYKKDKKTFFKQIIKTGKTITALSGSSFSFHKWLNGERNQIFFAYKLVLAEGNTEKLLADYLIGEKYKDNYGEISRFTVIDCGGKFNIHHWVNLAEDLGIQFYLLYDLDNNKDQKHKEINSKISDLLGESSYFIKSHISKDDIEVELFGSKVPKDEKHLIIEKIENGDADVAILENIKDIF